jgi:D-galactonate transporter
MAIDQEMPVDGEANRARLYRKVAFRLIPFLMICYAVAYLDRVNVGFAKLGMSADLGLSEAAFGLGAGIFFIGYFMFEVPSNVLLHKLGARTWIARIMVTWAVVSAACALMNGPIYFYVARFLLGIAEAGFFPGIILYLTYWFPSARRGQIIAVFMMAIPLAGLIGGPLSGLIMQQFDGLAGWAGWRWMFAVEAVPALLLGLAVPFMLDSRVADARWLSPEERAAIESDLESDQKGVSKAHARLRDLVTDPTLLRMALIYFCCIMGQYGITFWLPTLISNVAKGSSSLTVGLLSALPYACAIVVMALAGRNSDRTGERRWHLITMMVVGAFAIAASPLVSGAGEVVSVLALCLAAAAILTATPLFWNLPTASLTGAAAAVGIAAINSLGNLAGFLSPFLVGWINDLTGSAVAGLIFLAIILIGGATLVLTVKPVLRAGRRP